MCYIICGVSIETSNVRNDFTSQPHERNEFSSNGKSCQCTGGVEQGQADICSTGTAMFSVL